MKRIFTLIVVIIILIGGGLLYVNRASLKNYFLPKEVVPPAVSYQEQVDKASSTPPAEPTTPSVPTPPATPPPNPKPVETKAINLAVPFASQAPFGDWNMPYAEACEEASLIMTAYYLQGASLSKQQMKDGIDAMVAWQEKTWGGHKDITMKEEVMLAKQFYPTYSYQLIADLTAERIRQQLTLGRPVIVPAAGRELHNPNFKSPGPIYHMLVIKGFTKDGKFITNDPGTRNGADYIYTENVLMAAIHDWTGSAADGAKIGLVVYK